MRSGDRALGGAFLLLACVAVGVLGALSDSLPGTNWSEPGALLWGVEHVLHVVGLIPTPVWTVPVLLGNLWWARQRCPYLAQIEAHRLAVRGGDA